MDSQTILSQLNNLAHPENRSGMARYGIPVDRALGVSLPALRSLAKKIGKNHTLALELWETQVHEARLLSTLIDPNWEVTEEQMEKWTGDFNSWDICDQCCNNLWVKTPFNYKKAHQWPLREPELVRRAGFVMMASLAVHDKKAADSVFEEFFPLIRRQCEDPRNYVKKAVNWALRQIGKRNKYLNQRAIEVAQQIKSSQSPHAIWVAKDAIRELTSPSIQRRFQS